MMLTIDFRDWEWLGGSPNEVQSNYFGKGNETSYDRAVTSAVTSSQSTSHNYTIYWTQASCEWYIDGELTRTLNYADALSGENYPQTPMRVKLGIWAGGDSDNSEGTIEWAGGETDYDDAPFTMTVESVKIENFNPGASYTYGDQTGDWSSIDIEESDNSTSTTASLENKKTSNTAASTAFSTAISTATNSSSTPSATSSATATASAVTTTGGVSGQMSLASLWSVGLAAAGVAALYI